MGWRAKRDVEQAGKFIVNVADGAAHGMAACGLAAVITTVAVASAGCQGRRRGGACTV